MNITQQMKIKSLNGAFDTATIIEQTGDNKYIAEYKGVKCTAIFNVFAGAFYVDDVYGVLN